MKISWLMWHDLGEGSWSFGLTVLLYKMNELKHENLETSPFWSSMNSRRQVASVQILTITFFTSELKYHKSSNIIKCHSFFFISGKTVDCNRKWNILWYNSLSWYVGCLLVLVCCPKPQFPLLTQLLETWEDVNDDTSEKWETRWSSNSLAETRSNSNCFRHLER